MNVILKDIACSIADAVNKTTEFKAEYHYDMGRLDGGPAGTPKGFCTVDAVNIFGPVHLEGWDLNADKLWIAVLDGYLILAVRHRNVLAFQTTKREVAFHMQMLNQQLLFEQSQQDCFIRLQIVLGELGLTDLPKI